MNIQKFKDYKKINESAPRLPKKEDYWIKKGKTGKDVMIYTHDDMDGIFSAIVVKKYLKDAGFNIGTTNSPVTPVFLNGGPIEAVQLIIDLRENYKIFCSMVMYPVIPKDQIMLRLIPTAAHSMEDVEYTLKAFKEVKAKLDNGMYKGELNEVVAKYVS